MNYKSIVPLFIVLIALIVPQSSAQTGDAKAVMASSAGVLKNIPGVFVEVEIQGKDAKIDGLREADIRTDVELRLRIARIKVLSREQNRAASAIPILVVFVQALKHKDDTVYSYNVQLDLLDNATVMRGPTLGQRHGIVIKNATTWQQSILGTVDASELSTIRNEAKELVDQFCNDYLNGNP